jgi:hypothetical protein
MNKETGNVYSCEQGKWTLANGRNFYPTYQIFFRTFFLQRKGVVKEASLYNRLCKANGPDNPGMAVPECLS